MMTLLFWFMSYRMLALLITEAQKGVSKYSIHYYSKF